MTISSKMKALLQLTGKTQKGFADYLGVSGQAVNNKFYRNTLSVIDLIKIADYTGSVLSFTLPDGNKITLDISDIANES